MYTLLCIDEGHETVEVVQKALSPDRCVVISVTSVEAGLSIIEHQAVDIVLIDIADTRRRGIQALVQIKSLNPGVVVLMVSAEISSNAIIDSIHHGAFEFFVKPVGPEILQSAFDKIESKLERERQKTELLAKLQDTQLKLREHLEFRDSIVAHIVHDLRNQLSVIKSAFEITDFVHPEEFEGVAQEYLDHAKGSTKRLLEILDELTDVYHIDSPDNQLHSGEWNLSDILAEAVSNMSFLASRKNIELVFTKNKQILLTCDRQKLLQILENLLSNAVCYSPENGQVFIRIGTCNTEGREYGRVDIIDRGIGLAKDEVTRIFMKYYRGADAARLHPKGTGLGLAIVRELMQLHKGKLKVSSTLGKGSKFSLLLPL